MFIQTLLRMTDTMTSQNTDLSSSDTVYIAVFYLEPSVYQAVTHSIATFLYNFLLSNFPPSSNLASLLFPHYFLFLSCFYCIVSFFLFSFLGATAESGYCIGILHPGHVIRPWTDG